MVHASASFFLDAVEANVHSWLHYSRPPPCGTKEARPYQGKEETRVGQALKAFIASHTYPSYSPLFLIVLASSYAHMQKSRVAA